MFLKKIFDKKDNSDFTISYEQLMKPDKKHKTFLNNLFEYQDFKQRFGYLIGNKKTCEIKVNKIPVSKKKQDITSNLTIQLSRTEENGYKIEVSDKKGTKGFHICFDKDGEYESCRVESNIFSGDMNMYMREKILEMLGCKKDSLSDSAFVICKVKNSCKALPMHITRIFNNKKSWYIDRHNFIPDCGLEGYEEGIEFVKNLDIKQLTQLQKESKVDLKLSEFLEKITNCFNEAIKNKIFKEEKLEEISFFEFATMTSQSNDEKVHEIYHEFIKIVDNYAFLRWESPENLLSNEMIEKVENTAYEHFFNLLWSEIQTKEIKVMNF